MANSRALHLGFAQEPPPSEVVVVDPGSVVPWHEREETRAGRHEGGFSGCDFSSTVVGLRRRSWRWISVSAAMANT